ncbi:MAG: YjbF family lipoprotein [Pseudomonadota bacterium]
MKWIAFAAFAFSLGCGPLVQTNPVLGLAQTVAGGVSSEAEIESPGTGVLETVNRAFIEAQPNDLLLVSVISREAVAVVMPGGNNGSKTTWFSPDGISVTFDRGVLVATRGLGQDLMGADASRTLAAFGGGPNYLRTYDFLTGRDQIEQMSFTCSMNPDRSEAVTIYERTYQTTVFEEFCESDEFLIRNVYWRGTDGTIWQSRQWISGEIGYLGYQRL